MEKAKAGRPRSEEAREAVLGAASALLAECGGEGLAIEAIARRAGVGRPTIYRWWPTAADVALEAVLRQAGEAIPVERFPDFRETLGRFLRRSMAAIGKGGGASLRYLMAQAQKDEGFRERFREGFVAKRRAVLRSLFETAASEGRIGAGFDADLGVDMVFGAMWYRLLTGHAPLDETFADELTDVILRAAGGGLHAGK